MCNVGSEPVPRMSFLPKRNKIASQNLKVESLDSRISLIVIGFIQFDMHVVLLI